MEFTKESRDHFVEELTDSILKRVAGVLKGELTNAAEAVEKATKLAIAEAKIETLQRLEKEVDSACEECEEFESCEDEDEDDPCTGCELKDTEECPGLADCEDPTEGEDYSIDDVSEEELAAVEENLKEFLNGGDLKSFCKFLWGLNKRREEEAESGEDEDDGRPSVDITTKNLNPEQTELVEKFLKDLEALGKSKEKPAKK